MPTCIYETVPQNDAENPEDFEVKQSTQDPPLTKHPENGKPVRRVIVGGYGVLKSGATAPANGNGSGGGCCGPSGCC